MKTTKLLLFLAILASVAGGEDILTPVPGRIALLPQKQGSVALIFSTLKDREYKIFTKDDINSPWENTATYTAGGIALTVHIRADATKRFYKVAGPIVPVQVNPEKMVWIEPGSFIMGSPDNETGREQDEGPQTAVTISRGFWMGRHEVTQGEYEGMMGKNPSNFNGAGEWPWWTGGNDYGINTNRPVDGVKWSEAMEYCKLLSIRERNADRIPGDFAYRLPTEAEWEYACRAGTTGRFSHGNAASNLPAYAWYADNSDLETRTVGQKLPNNWGLYDMHGNVWEWCLDWWSENYPGGEITDPRGPSSGSERITRGGGWFSYAEYCRSANRSRYYPNTSDMIIGFRVVLGPVPD